jgi:Bacterial regulatory proteins, luxR family
LSAGHSPSTHKESGDCHAKLALSEHTIRNHLLRIYDKLGISSRVELVLYAASGTDSNPLPIKQ